MSCVSWRRRQNYYLDDEALFSSLFRKDVYLIENDHRDNTFVYI